MLEIHVQCSTKHQNYQQNKEMLFLKYVEKYMYIYMT